MIERYTLPPFDKLWSLENKYNVWLKVELAFLEARAELGEIDRTTVELIKKRAKFDIQEIAQIERQVQHDVIAFLTNVASYVGEPAKELHYGLTSYDMVDTALALLMLEAGEAIRSALEELLESLKKKALEEKYTPMIGRTHGVHAEPITLGVKFLRWYDEMSRNYERWQHALENIRYGKFSGAVGTYTHTTPELESLACKKLGLKPAPTSSQIIDRDRHAEYILTLAMMATSLEKIATELRQLQRTEIHEVEEFFGTHQKGSSAMPHKKNPILSERMCGLARIVRGHAMTALQNMVLWNERDISNSCVERIILPESTTLVYYMLKKTKDNLDNLRILRTNMKRNLELTRGVIFSEAVMLALIKKGLTRQSAYDMVQRAAFRSYETGKHFKHVLLEDTNIRKYLDESEIDSLFDLQHYFRHIDAIYKRVLG